MCFDTDLEHAFGAASDFDMINRYWDGYVADSGITRIDAAHVSWMRAQARSTARPKSPTIS